MKNMAVWNMGVKTTIFCT